MAKTLRHSSSNKSPLKWVGSKKRLATEIVKYFPNSFDDYYEPFLGGASIFLEAQPRTPRLSDLNSSLINFYEWLRTAPFDLMERASALETEFNGLLHQDDKKAFYYETRKTFNQSGSASTIENALTFLFLNRTSFNGLYRENAKGEFNVPFNNKEKLTLFEEQNILANADLFSRADLSCNDYKSAVSKATAGDLVYFDPPYIPISSTSAFTDYNKSSFGPKEQLHLRDISRRLVESGVTVILSNSFSPEVAELYKNFALHEVKINRLVAASKNSRGLISEYLIVGSPDA